MTITQDNFLKACSDFSDNWLRELSRWSPSLNVTCYYGSQDERKEMRSDYLSEDGELDFNVMVTT